MALRNNLSNFRNTFYFEKYFEKYRYFENCHTIGTWNIESLLGFSFLFKEILDVWSQTRGCIYLWKQMEVFQHIGHFAGNRIERREESYVGPWKLVANGKFNSRNGVFKEKQALRTSKYLTAHEKRQFHIGQMVTNDAQLSFNLFVLVDVNS